jgi:glutamate-1-semialdehyde 2,1-aminomutase
LQNGGGFVAMNEKQSAQAFAEAKKYIPGGVNSPVRSFGSVGGTPRFIARGKGNRIYDIDGNEYIDYVLSWGPMILGHAHPQVLAALTTAMGNGTSFGAPTQIETELAKLIQKAIPSMEMVRMVNSGTEATMSALRLARAYTKRNKIVKFTGCYHGHHDSLLVKAGSGAMTFGVPDSPGVPESIAGNTITVNFNDRPAMEEVFARHGREIAAVIIEAVPGNMGVILPKKGYLAFIREITAQHGALLIFDEVMTGFRVALHGAQGVFEIKPDLTCLSKIIGGGLPVGAYGGRREIMEHIAPSGPVYQAGTLSGNPLAMTAGVTTLKLLLETKGLYEKVTTLSTRLAEGLQEVAGHNGVAVQAHAMGGMFSIFFTDREVYDYETAKTSDVNAFNIYFHAMLEQGIYLSPSQFEACFMSYVHNDEEIHMTLKAADKAFAKVAAYKAGQNR